MSEYYKIEVKAKVGDSDDVNPAHLLREWEIGPLATDENKRLLLQVHSTAKTVDISEYDTVNFLMIKNITGTGTLTLTWRSAANGSTDNKIEIDPNKFGILPDVDSATALGVISSVDWISYEIILV